MPHALPSFPSEILLVEDNAGDVRLLREALKECHLSSHLSVVRDGEQALAFLHRSGAYQKCPRPALILLDFNLPRKDGREVLAAIKQDDRLRGIPVIVLSSSTQAGDIARAYDLHANCFIPKPSNLEQLVSIGRQIETFWLGTAVLPAASAAHR
ncbi:MAG TPA: response regulator [Bryobacteraceae bacterium]|nr:response regulator [Bryobacteraceae bacterium]